MYGHDTFTVRKEAVSNPLREGDRHIMRRRLSKMSRSPAVWKRLLVFGFLASAAWLGGPGLDSVAWASRPTAAADHGESAAATDDSGASQAAAGGVALGDYRIRVYHPIEAQKSTVTFTLYAHVARENVSEFALLLEHRRQKVRDQVILATRLAPLVDYDDPVLGDFRQRILLRLRRMLPELAIEDLYVSDFELEVRAR
jgi:hypothetical protein